MVVTDTTAPANPSISINSGADNTTFANVTLAISATDALGITGYYASESSTAPANNVSGWTSVTSSTSYSDNVSFTLTSAESAGNFTRTVYLWFKDGSGNVSSSSSDTITLRSLVATQISAGLEHTCALDNESSVYCWGKGTYGSLA